MLQQTVSEDKTAMHRSSPALKRGNSTLGLRRAPSPQARAVSPSLASAPSVQAKAALFSQRSNGHGRASSPIHGTGTEIKSVTNASAHSTVDGNTRPTIRSRAKNHWQQAISEARSSRKSQATRIAVKTQPTQNEEAERRREERRIEVIAREAEKRARHEDELKCKREEERAQLEAKEQARREAEEQMRLQAEEKARREAEDRARHQAEQKAQIEAEVRAKKEAEKRERAEFEAQVRKEVEEKMRQEAKARKDAEIAAKQKAKEDALRAAEEQCCV